MASPFDRLMNTVRPYLPGALDDAIKQELFFVCQEFLDRSDAWTEEVEFVVPAGERKTEIAPFAGRVNRLLYVTLDDRAVRGVTLGAPEANGYIPIIMPLRDSYTHPYVATVALTVSDPVNRDAFPIMPNEIVERYTQVLMDGLLSRMYLQPNKPYSNAAMAAVYTTKFRGGAARAKNEAVQGRTRGSQAWSFPQAFNRRK